MLLHVEKHTKQQTNIPLQTAFASLEIETTAKTPHMLIEIFSMRGSEDEHGFEFRASGTQFLVQLFMWQHHALCGLPAYQSINPAQLPGTCEILNVLLMNMRYHTDCSYWDTWFSCVYSKSL
jgi:hypothetical protein